jgi:hypothetical protein
MPARRLPVRPDLTQLKHQAKDLLTAIRNGDAEALADLAAFHPHRVPAAKARLVDAQLVLARSYGASSWPRLGQSCQLIDAIWADDIDAVRRLVEAHPYLLTENAGIRNNNWGPPMSYAANLGRDRMIMMLYQMGARDLKHAIDRAALQGEVDTARILHDLLGKPPVPADSLGGPAYTLNTAGTALMLELGAKVVGPSGQRLAPVDVVLESDSRKPADKHAILEMYAQHGLTLPDTPTMALHRGRIDLLEAHLRRDPRLLSRTFSHEEIFPPDLGCHVDPLATQGTPLDGTTLLHMCADFDEVEITRWLLERGADVNTRATFNAEGLGGHTALFGAVVSQAAFWPNYQHRSDEAPIARLILDHGADLTVRASLRKRLHPGYDYNIADRVYREVTPYQWGVQFEPKVFVSGTALRLIEERGGAG